MASLPIRAQGVLTVAGVLAAAALCIWWVLFRTPAVLAQDGAEPVKAKNPHWKANACGECHVDAGAPRAIPAAKVDATCVRCHDGKSATSEVHPIARAIDTAKMDFPAGWPLNGGRLSCATCHDVKVACSQKALRPDENTEMLRSSPPVEPVAKGAEPVSKPFCLSCHREEQYPKFNPHLMLKADRQVDQDKCLACHKEAPDRNVTRATGKTELLADQLSLCKACHPHHEDQFNPGHIGAKVKPEMLAFMRARESVGLAATPSKDLVAKLQAEGAKPTLLRPDEQNLLKCNTCHNPHQAGVFKSGTPAAFGAMRVIGNKVVSPVHGEHFCNHCHSDI